MTVRTVSLAMGLIYGMVWVAAVLADDSRPLYETDILPVFKARCGECHGDPGRKGDLNLLTWEGFQRGGESGDALIGATLDDSPLWNVIANGDMPPNDQPPLSHQERDLIQRWLALGGPAQHSGPNSQPQLNQHDILPIVLLRCTTCHGAQRQDGKLDLRTPAGMRRGGKSGPALVPGDPSASLMVQRIESEACPPRELLLKFFVRRPSSSEVTKLRDWIAAGAPEIDIAPDVATTEPDPLVTDQDRQHWAFQPPRDVGAGHSIDEFIEGKLRSLGLNLSPAAERTTLIRRAYLDLIGLPPSLEEFQRWTNLTAEDWYPQMIDHLLSSPHYGERWGRYWLDLAGYADSEGGTSADPLRPLAWKYRDYVIAAFNNDKPYDRFLLEQLAGDELLDYRQAETITEEMVENLTATGFLRMGIDETGSRTMNFVPERLKVISDAITVVSSGLMAMTLECARCHSHKYDPIPHRDYYRFKAIFQGALDEHDWKSYQKRSLELATPEHLARVAEVNPPLEREIKQLLARQKEVTTQIQLSLLQHHYPEQSEADNQATLAALKVADNNRTLPQKILVEKLLTAEVMEDDQQSAAVLAGRAELATLQSQIDALRRRQAPALAIRALWDQGRPSPTYILRRGEHDKPGPLVGPGVPSVLTDGRTPFEVTPPFGDAADGNGPTGRRLAFAKWLTRPDHPLTARVLVNRVWYHHFGTGLAKDLDNFGVKGEPPSHPELLDWLAVDFVEHGWSIKRLHRLIMNSRTYQQSSQITEQMIRLDPQGRWLSHMPMRRVDAEALRDSLLAISGRLDTRGGGLPDTVSVDRDGLVSLNPTEGGGWRRSIYAQYRRTELPTMLDTFDYPQMGPNCLSRSISIVSPQALLLMNNAHVHELAGSFAERLLSEELPPQTSIEQRIQTAYRLALVRDPSPNELRLGVAALQQFSQAWNGDHMQTWTSYCHTLFNSAAFLYID